MKMNQEVAITGFQAKTGSIKTSTVRIICFVVFSLLIVAQAWIADDAYHGFVMTKNFMNGYGLVYYIGWRTNAATCPLMLLLTTFLSCLTRHIELTAIAIGLVTSMTAFWILIRRIESKSLLILATLLCSLSLGFISYTTSGLETSLIYLIQIIFFDYVLNHKENYTFKQLLYLSFLCSLSLLTRFDTCFLMFFPTAYIFLKKKECGIFKMLIAGILGLLPFFAWLGFSVVYYGYPFPNTYYIKIRTDLSIMDYLVKGINFYGTGFLCDTTTMLTIFFALIIMIRKGDFLRRMIAVGMIMKMIYILRIGGDFMLGRHFAGLFFVSVYIIFEHAGKNKWFDKKKTVFTGLSISVLFAVCLITSAIFLHPNNDVADERLGYIQYTSIFRIIESEITNKNYPLLCFWQGNEEIEDYIDNGYKGAIIGFAPGITVYNFGDRIHLTDQGSVADPLLPYAGVDWNRSSNFSKGTRSSWRIGHLQRAIPDGYRESLQYDANLIKDPETHELYDKILLVVRGDIFTKERFKTIWELNTKYKHFTAKE